MRLSCLLIVTFVCVGGLVRAECEYPGPGPSGLTTRDGFVEFIPASQLQPFKEALPTVSDAGIEAILKSADTMWYDETSMVYLYQDSVEDVVGARANCVGREVGLANQDNPGIAKLLNYFGPDYRFDFPFRKVAGTDNVDNLKAYNFWAPPKLNGKVMPVKYWRPTSRGRWFWVFPVGTVFGEVLFEQGPDSHWYPFEIRTRTRYLDGWDVDVFRPFVTAESLAQAIKSKRPSWSSTSDLAAFVNALENKNTLVANRWESKPFALAFSPIDGALDPLPAISDAALIEDLLSHTTFISAKGRIWKENGTLQTYAPSSQGEFSIVPKGYELGMIPVNEISCNNCHSQTGRNLGDFEFDIQLYGEVWGEDHIFTWHLFEVRPEIYNTFDDADGSRTLNPRLSQANLVVEEQPADGDPYYKALPMAFHTPDDSARSLEKETRFRVRFARRFP